MRPARQICSVSAAQCERRRKILDAESSCWNAYKKSYSHTPTLVVDRQAERLRRRLVEVSFKLHGGSFKSDLCCICRCVDFGFYYDGKHSLRGLIAADKIPLGHLDDLDNRCSLCNVIMYSVNQDPSLVKTKSNLVCILEVGRHQKHPLNVDLWATPLDEHSTDENINTRDMSYLEYHDLSPNLYRFLHRTRLVKMANDSAWLPWKTSRVSSREISSTVNFSRIKRLLRLLDLEEDSVDWPRWLISRAFDGKILKDWRWRVPTRLLVRGSSDAQSLELRHDKDESDFSREIPAKFRVIDVHQRCLVDPPTTVRYIALSYVWGNVVPPIPLCSKASCPGLYRPGAIGRLGESVPRTVRDAIVATKELGERFLWTDALCIIQDDEQEKQDQINKMSGVYRRASFTIVAAAGNDANAGLPGVGSTTRSHWQHTIGGGHKQFVNVGYSLDVCLVGCHWLTRGWTYQELALSSQLVIFTQQEVFVVDAQPAITMDNAFTYRSESNVSRVKAEGPANSFQDHIVSKPRDALGLFGIALDAYSQRKLTFESDALNAFQGVAGYLNPELQGGFTFGAPSTFLEVGLSWAVYNNDNNKPKVNDRFPSYSWASQSRRVFVDRPPKSRWPASRVLWQNFHPQRRKEWICQEDFMPNPESDDAAKWQFVPVGTPMNGRTNPKEIGVTRPFWKDTTEQPPWQHAWPILPKHLLPPFEPAEPGTGHLSLWSHVIFVSLEAPRYDQRWQAVMSEKFVDKTGRYGRGVCYFNMDQLTFTNPVEALLLCKYEKHDGFPRPIERDVQIPVPWDVSKAQQDAIIAKEQSATKESDPSRDTDEYVCLAIETINGISYRRGVGVMEMSRFHEAGPQRKHVVLG